MAEALELAREGVSFAEIDKAAVDFGMPMGPVELIDSVGIDVGLHVAEILSPLVGREVAPELKERVAAGGDSHGVTPVDAVVGGLSVVQLAWCRCHVSAHAGEQVHGVSLRVQAAVHGRVAVAG